MASGRAADREDPDNSRRNAARSLDWDPIGELHQGQRSWAPHRKAGHMTAPDHIARIAAKTLARGGRPHMNRAVAGVVAARDIGKRLLAAVTPLDRLALLMRRGFRSAARLHAARLRPLAAFRRARPDQGRAVRMW